MWHFRIFGFPVHVHWLFWLTMAFLGGGISADTPAEWGGVLIWVAAAFVSVLVHELGHAVAAQRTGAWCSIFLHGLGGLTRMQNLSVTRNQNIWISFAGPLAGICLGLVALALVPLVMVVKSQWLAIAVFDLVQINILWSLFNLLPVLPMDGGQILRDFLGPRKIKIAVWTGAIFAGIFCLLALYVSQWFLMVFFGYLAYANYKNLPVEGGTMRN